MRRLIRYEGLYRLFGITHTPQHLLRLQKEVPPAFPLRVKRGNFNWWYEDEVAAWVETMPRAKTPRSSSEE